VILIRCLCKFHRRHHWGGGFVITIGVGIIVAIVVLFGTHVGFVKARPRFASPVVPCYDSNDNTLASARPSVAIDAHGQLRLKK
jgi:hypothetical protein